MSRLSIPHINLLQAKASSVRMEEQQPPEHDTTRGQAQQQEGQEQEQGQQQAKKRRMEWIADKGEGPIGV